MKKIIVTLLFSAFSFSAFASSYWTSQTPVHVNGYSRSDGTYVQPYYRAAPGTSAGNNEAYNSYDSTYHSNYYSN